MWIFSSIAILLLQQGSTAFTPNFKSLSSGYNNNDALRSTKDAIESSEQSNLSDDELQWKLFKQHHASNKRWKGTWTTLDYMGDTIDETMACVELKENDDGSLVSQTHEMVVEGKVSDCTTCFDSFETQTMPVANYESGKLFKQRLASVAMVNGPRVLRSGSMTTELVLRHGDGRVRVIFYHAPAWKDKDAEYVTPPDGLKFYRAMYPREEDREEVPNSIQEQFPNEP